MDNHNVFPNASIIKKGIISEKFLNLGIDKLWNACQYVHDMPYGYNSNKDDILILLKEGYGSCTTKHAVIATLADELGIPIYKSTGIYAMSEEIVTGTKLILDKYKLPYLPMIHCFLIYENYRVDLTEGNNNGKNHSIEEFLFTKKVIPNISEKDEYLIYREALKETILKREEMINKEMNQVLQARQEGLVLLKSKVGKALSQSLKLKLP
jgi:hypothetical protein